ncbi:hypothetical protein V8G69_07185 [Gaetbulibacter sp. M235]|uniref:hypothetical protein n=1 Tax=Gaetbulibacter sp. M235 TaxID=3126510 RepID=UPI00374EDE21
MVKWEFTLYMQDDHDGLVVFFPSGWFSIKELFSKNDFVKFSIKTRSKSIAVGNQINDIIEVILKPICLLKK